MALQTLTGERTTTEYARGAMFGLAAVSIWAGNIVVAGLGLRSSLTPWDIAAIRFAVAGLILVPYLMRRGLALDRLGWIGLAALVLGGAPTVLLANAGLLFAPASHAGALFPGVMPLMVAVLAAAVLKEAFTPQKRVGFALIATGVVGIVWVVVAPSALHRTLATCCLSALRWPLPATQSRCAGQASMGFTRRPSPQWVRCWSTCPRMQSQPAQASSIPCQAP